MSLNPIQLQPGMSLIKFLGRTARSGPNAAPRGSRRASTGWSDGTGRMASHGIRGTAARRAACR